MNLLIEKANADKIAMVVQEDGFVEKGALLSYGPNSKALGVQAARLVAKVLKGERPSEIPSEVPDKLMLLLI